MDQVNYQRLFQTINAFIETNTYESIEDPFIRQVLVELMHSSGKRLRSILCCTAHEFFSPLTENTLHVAHAIELFHNFTLVHDDIMDKAPLRRDKPTVYALYGNDKALLIGDIILIQAYDELNKIIHPQKQEIFFLFNKTAKEICIGQYMDLHQSQQLQDQKDLHWQIEDYITMIRLKTAVLLGRSLYIGALLGGATTRLADQFYEIGTLMGLLFQVQDDYLDAFGNSEKVGKQKGGDILQGKKNILYFKAIEYLSLSDQNQLNHYISPEYTHQNKVESVLNLYQKASVAKHIGLLQESYLNRIKEKIVQLDIDKISKQNLNNLAIFILTRAS